MSQALKSRVNNLASSVSMLNTAKHPNLNITGNDTTAFRLIDANQNVRSLKTQGSVSPEFNPADQPLTVGGVASTSGPTGQRGATGLQGSQDPTGERGAQGVHGTRGLQWSQCPAAERGPQHFQGAR